MKRSRLEICIDILEVLAFKGRLKLTHIMNKTNVNCTDLKWQLCFLLKNGLVEEKIFKKEKVFYAITPRGMSILKAFREIKQIFLAEENEIKQSSFSAREIVVLWNL